MMLDRLTVDLLARALDQSGALVSRIRRDQAGLPTPCPAFDVRALVNHTVYDLRPSAPCSPVASENHQTAT